MNDKNLKKKMKRILETAVDMVIDKEGDAYNFIYSELEKNGYPFIDFLCCVISEIENIKISTSDLHELYIEISRAGHSLGYGEGFARGREITNAGRAA